MVKTGLLLSLATTRRRLFLHVLYVTTCLFTREDMQDQLVINLLPQAGFLAKMAGSPLDRHSWHRSSQSRCCISVIPKSGGVHVFTGIHRLMTSADNCPWMVGWGGERGLCLRQHSVTTAGPMRYEPLHCSGFKSTICGLRMSSPPPLGASRECFKGCTYVTCHPLLKECPI